MAIIDDGQQNLDVLPPSHHVLFQEDLERVARSDDMAVEEQRLSRLAKQRTRTENNRANETSLETQQRRQRDREYHAQSALQADMAIIDDGQQDLDVFRPSHHVLFQEDL